MAEYYTKFRFPASALLIAEINEWYLENKRRMYDVYKISGIVCIESKGQLDLLKELRDKLSEHKIAYEMVSETDGSEAPYKQFYNPDDEMGYIWSISNLFKSTRLVNVEKVIEKLRNGEHEELLADLEEKFPELDIENYRGGWEGNLHEDIFLKIDNSLTLYVNHFRENEVHYQFEHNGERGLIHPAKLITIDTGKTKTKKKIFFVNEKPYSLSDFTNLSYQMR